jgi:predicted nucleotidyltransferase component of viral defense system
LGLLKKIRANNIFNNLRLVGGTALALQIGHRKSVDIDLFGKINLADDEIVKYPYPWIYDPIIEDNPVLAHILDIASMKLSAITNRGTKKDFIDIYFLLQNYTLKDILRLYEKKYPDGSVFFVLKSLVYFEDAENEPMPEMFTDISWEEVKNFIVEQTKNY